MLQRPGQSVQIRWRPVLVLLAICSLLFVGVSRLAPAKEASPNLAVVEEEEDEAPADIINQIHHVAPAIPAHESEPQEQQHAAINAAAAPVNQPAHHSQGSHNARGKLDVIMLFLCV